MFTSRPHTPRVFSRLISHMSGLVPESHHTKPGSDSMLSRLHREGMETHAGPSSPVTTACPPRLLVCCCSHPQLRQLFPTNDNTVPPPVPQFSHQLTF